VATSTAKPEILMGVGRGKIETFCDVIRWRNGNYVTKMTS